MKEWIRNQVHVDARGKSVVFWCLTAPLALIYACISAFRGMLYDRRLLRGLPLPGRVISIGNICVGGTGKTPMATSLARWLMADGKQPAILTRGYRSSIQKSGWLVLLDGKPIHGSDVRVFAGDEPMQLSKSLPSVPVIIGRDRFSAAIQALRSGLKLPTHWLLEDGFQHRALKRDVDIVLLDAQRPFGSQWMLPLGDLRESPRALRRASLIIFTRAESGTLMPQMRSQVQHFAPRGQMGVSQMTFSALVCQSDPALTFVPAVHGPALVAAAIARPETFRQALANLGVVSGREVFLRDHLSLDVPVFHSAAQSCRSVIVTEKDYWRSPEMFAQLPIPTFVLPMELVCPDDDKKMILDFVR